MVVIASTPAIKVPRQQHDGHEVCNAKNSSTDTFRIIPIAIVCEGVGW